MPLIEQVSDSRQLHMVQASLASICLASLISLPLGCSSVGTRATGDAERPAQAAVTSDEARPQETRDPVVFDDMRSGRDDASPRPAIDPETKKRFMADYELAGSETRGVFEKYLPILGANGILDILEDVFPKCHGQSHDLGKALFASTQDIGEALRTCTTRCTSGCMHGILMEAFGSSDIDTLKGSMIEFCQSGAMSEIHKIGNCAHGMGHAFMAASSGDVDVALAACKGFSDRALPHYCATGVFMELLDTGPRAREFWRDDPERGLHDPCDKHTQFPAACYRYRAPQMRHFLKGDWERLMSECLALSGPVRLGCFHGAGHAHTSAVYEDPAFLARLCGQGDENDQAMCVEGAIEKLADYDEEIALEACSSLSGATAQVCKEAAEHKMYRLNKPTLDLYWGD